VWYNILIGLLKENEMLNYFIIAVGVIILSFIIVYLVATVGMKDKAKKVAREMIAQGKIIDERRYTRVLNILNAMNSLEGKDLEAEDLWHKLTAMKN
jgi:Zn-dependent membrane protease YugP